MTDFGSPSSTLVGSDLVMPESGKIRCGPAVMTPVGQRRTTHQPVFYMRQRYPIASVNAGADILTGLAGLSFRMVDCKMVAIGGAVTTVTTIDILGTQNGSSVKLVAFAQASLTQSTVLTAGGAGATVLADGASYALTDPGAGITINITGDAATVVTHIDVYFSYVVEA